MNKQIKELTRNNLIQISEKFSLTLESYIDIVYQVYLDKDLVRSLSKYHDAAQEEQASLYFKINERIKQFAESKTAIRSISLVCKTGESITYDSQTGSALDNIWRDYTDLRETVPYRMTHGKNEVVLVPTQKFIENGAEEMLFFIGKELYDTENLQEGAVAVLIMGIYEGELNAICNGKQSDIDQKHSANFITDAEGSIISFPNTSYIGRKLLDGQDELDFIRETEIFSDWDLGSIRYQDPETGWMFYNIYDKNYIMKDVNSVQNIYRALLAVDVLVVIVFINSINHYFMTYLSKIMDGIHQVEKGNLDVWLEVDRQDEFGRIGQNFNQMTGKVKNLIQEVTEISEKKNQAEIKALESQINPHFLYNTLDAINWMAIRQEEYEISKMINDLGFILRYSMNQSNQMIAISEVEQWLGCYIPLYQMRYGGSFDFHIHIEQEVRSVKLYKLLLQPVIENAILHGIRDMEEGLLQIDIGMAQQPGKIHVVVEDNGIGMEETQVKYYNQRDLEWTGEKGIGLANVFERIQLYYGKEGEWYINSVEGVGTIVELVLPVSV
ncbi:histidine kinase [Lachnospiraceae bacterium 29-84]